MTDTQCLTFRVISEKYYEQLRSRAISEVISFRHFSDLWKIITIYHCTGYAHYSVIWWIHRSLHSVFYSVTLIEFSRALLRTNSICLLRVTKNGRLVSSHSLVYPEISTFFLSENEQPSGAQELIGYEQGESNIEDETVRFFYYFQDHAVLIFSDISELLPPLTQLIEPAKLLLHFCCARTLSSSDCVQQFIFAASFQSTHGQFTSSNSITVKLESNTTFCDYVDRTRNRYINEKGWQQDVISIPAWRKSNWRFRDVVQLLKDEIAKYSGAKIVFAINTDNENSTRIWSSPLDSYSIKLYNINAIFLSKSSLSIFTPTQLRYWNPFHSPSACSEYDLEILGPYQKFAMIFP